MGSIQIPCCSLQPACTEPVPFRTYISLFHIYFLSLCLKVVCADGQHPNTMLLSTASVHGAVAVLRLHLSLTFISVPCV